MKLSETSLPQNYSKGLLEDKRYDFPPEYTDRITATMFVAVAQILASQKSKENPVAFIIDRLDGKVVAAAIVRLIENEDENNPANWTLAWTFDEADIPDNARKLYLKDPLTHPYFVSVAATRHNVEFRTESVLVNMITYLVETMYKWLDENAKMDEEVTVEQDGIFQARVAIEAGQKIFSLEPAGEIKMLIKDDASVEK